MSTPITVLMSVYNGERWLGESIGSILNQSFVDFEFIIVNDGSSDSSLEIIQNYAAKDTRIIVIDKSNTGLADSLNVGIWQSRGEWIARIDADDLAEPARLERQIQKAQSSPNLVLIGTGLRIINDTATDGAIYRYPGNHETLVRNLQTAKRFFAHSSAMYRSKTVKNLGGYRTRIKRAQDWDLWLRISELGRLACIKEPLVKVRKHGDQISNDEGGFRQKVDCRVAIVSYWLRQMGYQDPVSNEFSNEQFIQFRGWVEQKVELSAAKELDNFTSYIKKVIEKKQGLQEKLLQVAKHILLQPEISFRVLLRRTFGDLTPRFWAAEWIKSR